MSDTLSEFVNFISEDPLMLALSLAIIVLVLIFILVLCLGNKGSKKKSSTSSNLDNTTELLKSDIINTNDLRSTQEFNIPSLMNQVDNGVKNVPNMQPNVLTQNVNFNSMPEEIVSPTSESVNNAKKPVEANEIPIIPNNSFEVKSDNAWEATPEKENPSLEETLNEEVTPIPVVNNEPVINVEVPTTSGPMQSMDLPKMGTEKKPETFSSVTLNNEPIPTNDYNETSKTEIIKHVDPNMSLNDDMDIDLPKLNTNKGSTVLSALEGEAFNIQK